jgi:hypothetical protein
MDAGDRPQGSLEVRRDLIGAAVLVVKAVVGLGLAGAEVIRVGDGVGVSVGYGAPVGVDAGRIGTAIGAGREAVVVIVRIGATEGPGAGDAWAAVVRVDARRAAVWRRRSPPTFLVPGGPRQRGDTQHRGGEVRPDRDALDPGAAFWGRSGLRSGAVGTCLPTRTSGRETIRTSASFSAVGSGGSPSCTSFAMIVTTGLPSKNTPVGATTTTGAFCIAVLTSLGGREIRPSKS